MSELDTAPYIVRLKDFDDCTEPCEHEDTTGSKAILWTHEGMEYVIATMFQLHGQTRLDDEFINMRLTREYERWLGIRRPEEEWYYEDEG